MWALDVYIPEASGSGHIEVAQGPLLQLKGPAVEKGSE